jgi:uncharacterized protein YbjT (DUF2867 family)
VKTVLVTGANGFIAQEVARRLRREGWRVIGTTRTGEPVGSFHLVHRCRLGESLQAALAGETLDAVIHAANDAGEDQYDTNVHGTGRWFDEAAPCGNPVQLFLSSLSAAAAQPTEYGRAKRDLEPLFLRAGGIVVRLALVAGNGGVFGRMIRTVRQSRIVPLLDGGRAPVFLVPPDFLVDFVHRAITGPGPFAGRTWHVHQPEPRSLAMVMQSIRRATASRCLFVPVPSWAVLPALLAVERLTPLRLPLSSTNVRGLRATPRHAPSDFPALGGVASTLDELVAAAIRAGEGNP